MEKIKVMVVDDSTLMRTIIKDMINSQHDMVVCDMARNGEELISKVLDIRPDVITLDVEMPKMDGITALKKLKSMDIDVPVIMLSSITKKGALLTLRCLENGAFDFIPKPSGEISLDINKVKDELIEKIHAASEREMKHEKNEPKANIMPVRKNIHFNNIVEAVAIGASTGGPKALYEVITELPKNLGVPVFVVQHMPAGFTKAFAERLDLNSEMEVTEASDNERVKNGVVYIAPGGYHMEIGTDRVIHLNTKPHHLGVRPSVDNLFLSLPEVYGSHIVSAVLTGMGKDGAIGTAAIKDAGGYTIAEDKSTCTIYGMPKAVYETGKCDIVLPLDKIAGEIANKVLR